MELLELIEELSQIAAPAGFEDAAAARITEYLTPFMDEIKTDAMGNVIAVKRCGKPGAEKVLLDAHMDEVGFIVTDIEEGYLKFALLGSVDPRNLPGREVMLMTEERLFGVIACLPPHVLSAEDREKVIAVKDLFIDTGLSHDEAVKRIPVGTPGVFRGEFFKLGESLCGKALDDRLCVSVMLDAVSQLKDKKLDVDLYVMASVQEELGTRGAAAGAFGIAPDYCIAIDVTHGKTPDAPKTGVYKTGGGPTIGIGPNMNRNITKRLMDTCDKYDIAYQPEVMAGSSGTNAWPIQISREGVSTAVLSIPLKYMHSPVETFMLSDAKDASKLLVKLLEDWGR